MLKPEPSHRFKRDLKKYQHNKPVKEALDTVLKLLINEEPLPAKFRDHALIGNYIGCRECHLKPDTLLIYWTDSQCVYLARIGSHSELM